MKKEYPFNGPPRMFYITKYALTSGIIERKGRRYQPREDAPVYVNVESPDRLFLTPGQYHETMAEAATKVVAMVDRKLKSLEKQVKKLKTLRAEFEGRSG